MKTLKLKKPKCFGNWRPSFGHTIQVCRYCFCELYCNANPKNKLIKMKKKPAMRRKVFVKWEDQIDQAEYRLDDR